MFVFMWGVFKTLCDYYCYTVIGSGWWVGIPVVDYDNPQYIVGRNKNCVCNMNMWFWREGGSNGGHHLDCGEMCRLSKLNAGSLMGQSLLQKPQPGLCTWNDPLCVNLLWLNIDTFWSVRRFTHPRSQIESVRRMCSDVHKLRVGWSEVRPQTRSTLRCSICQPDGGNGCCTGK